MESPAEYAKWLGVSEQAVLDEEADRTAHEQLIELYGDERYVEVDDDA